jgi:hypothetical protein
MLQIAKKNREIHFAEKCKLPNEGCPICLELNVSARGQDLVSVEKNLRKVSRIVS